MRPALLIEAVQACYVSFKPTQTTIDSHIEAYIAAKKIDAVDAAFLQQVVYGCLRYKKLIKVVLTALYLKHGTEVSREDYHLYMVMAYLAILRLEDLTLPAFRKFVMAQDKQKMFVLLSFIFSSHNLDQWMREEWCKIFDEHYVNDELIATMLRQLPEMSQLIERLRELSCEDTEKAADIATPMAASEPKHTKVEPFNLTRPKPRLLPEPEAIPVGFSANPLPASTYKEPLLASKVAEAKERARNETVAKHATAKRPVLATDSRPTNLDRLREDAERKFEDTHKYIAPKPNRVPKPDAAKQMPVRLNTAAVLREDALLQKKLEEEYRLIRQYESELRDPSEFLRWQKEALDKDEAARLEEIERRRAEMVQTDISAREARERLVQEKRLAVSQTQVERDAARLKKLEEERAEVIAKRMLVKQVAEEESKVGKKVEAVQAEKIAAAIVVREEKKAIAKAHKEAKAKEEAERMDLVRQIRALEAVRIDRASTFDPTEPAGLGILEEMPLAELRERLAVERTRRKEEEEEKRAAIIRQKQQKEEEIADKLAALARRRNLAAREAHEKRVTAKTMEELAKVRVKEVKEKSVVELSEKLAKKREEKIAEQERLAAEIREIQIKRQFLAAGAAQVEETKWRELERGAERALALSVRAQKETDIVAKQTKAKHKKNWLLSREREEEERLAFMREYQQRMELAASEATSDDAYDVEQKKLTVQQQRKQEERLHETMVVAHPYAAAQMEAQKQKTMRIMQGGGKTGVFNVTGGSPTKGSGNHAEATGTGIYNVGAGSMEQGEEHRKVRVVG